MNRNKIIGGALATIVVALAMLAMGGTAFADQGGRTGRSGNPATGGGATCSSCHSGGIAPTVTLTGPTTVAPGSVNVYTLTISGGQRVSGGLDVSATAGTLASIAGEGTRLQSLEITHSTDKPVNAAGNVVFNFNWTAPASGSAILYGAGVSSDGDGSENGDGVARTTLAIAVAAAPATYTITASSGANGSVTPSGVTTVNSGASQAYVITPNTGYYVAGVLVDGVSAGAVTSYTFSNVTANHTISATFAANTGTTYVIRASAGANGSITPSGVVSVNPGSSQAFTITPRVGYRIAYVKVDGVSVGAVTSYTFNNVTANHTIVAGFAWNAPKTYTVTASTGGNGSITPSGGVKVVSGASRTFTITPNTGYHVAYVKVDGVSVGAVTSYTFNNVTANHTIVAVFGKNEDDDDHEEDDEESYSRDLGQFFDDRYIFNIRPHEYSG